MNETKWNNKTLDAALKLALEAHEEKDLAAIDETLSAMPTHELTPQFKRNLDRKIAKKRIRKAHGLMRAIRRVAVVFLIMAAFSTAFLLTAWALHWQLWRSFESFTRHAGIVQFFDRIF